MIQNHPCNPGYVSEVLAMYIKLPETPSRTRPADRRLAEDWQRSGITLQIIESALLLGQLRRLTRPPDYPKLNPIRSLYYFVPLIEEVMDKPLPDGYVEYMKSKLRNLHAGKLGFTPAERSQTGA
jgi:hypothetical protein